MRQARGCCEGGQASSSQAGSICLRLVAQPAASHRFLPSAQPPGCRAAPLRVVSAAGGAVRRPCLVGPSEPAGRGLRPQRPGRHGPPVLARLALAAWGRGPLRAGVSGPCRRVCSLEASSSFSQCLGPAASRRGSGRRIHPGARGLLGGGAPRGLSRPSCCCLAPGWEPLLSEGFRAARLAPQLRAALQGARPTRSPGLRPPPSGLCSSPGLRSLGPPPVSISCLLALPCGRRLQFHL